MLSILFAVLLYYRPIRKVVAIRFSPEINFNRGNHSLPRSRSLCRVPHWGETSTQRAAARETKVITVAI